MRKKASCGATNRSASEIASPAKNGCSPRSGASSSNTDHALGIAASSGVSPITRGPLDFVQADTGLSYSYLKWRNPSRRENGRPKNAVIAGEKGAYSADLHKRRSYQWKKRYPSLKSPLKR